MELDVHLTREGDEPWGLELDGGRDCCTPLIIAQVYPSSPADAAGLQPGDRVTRVGDKLASELTQHAAHSLLAEAVGSLSFGVCRGLYDPVLDDFEAIYEPVERADSDLRSEPTEVSPPRCVDFPELPLSDLYDFRPITESRSLTASPFLTQTKPFRPFSTEPLSVPPLEDPIILNPKFKDDFAELLDGIDIDKVETKYKLPVSKQYDPNYKKKVDGLLEKSMERDVPKVNGVVEKDYQNVNDTLEIRTEVTETNEIQQEVMQLKEVRFEEEIKHDIDVVNIEQTAIDVVEESIERAVSVTKEIQEAVEEELRASATRDIVEEKHEVKSEERSQRLESVQTLEAFQSEKITDEVVKESKEARRKETVFESSKIIADKPKELMYVRENKNKVKTHEVKTEISEFSKENYVEATETTKESEGKQKSFNIGLQTIPNIKGMVQSSFHFDLLMRTFFIHLTDVMVAMSRFILTQPALELETKAERVINDNLIVGLGREKAMKSDAKSQECHKFQQNTDIRKNTVKQEFNARNEQDIEEKRQVEKHSEIIRHEHLDMELEEFERKRLSGAEMAQRTQRKPKELTHIMDAVISEFETKTGIEDRLEVTEQRARSRSRSRIEEEVMNESDPLEWLSKVDQQTNIKTSSLHTESKKTRSEHESSEVRTSKTKPGKQMYVAVVESHVYTNKDQILQEMLETSSVESSEEMSTSEINQSIKQQAVVVITQALEESNVIAVAESTVANTEFLETTEMSLKASKELTETKVSVEETDESKQELLTTVASETTEIVEDLQARSFNALDVSEKTAVVSSEENYKTIAVQSTETLFEESREEVTELKISEKHATSKIEQLAIAVAESTDVVFDDSKVEIFEAEQPRAKTAVVKEEEGFRTAAIETIEVTSEEAIEQHAVVLETEHATIKETNNLAVAGIIETKTEEDKVIIPKPVEDEYASLKIIKQEIIDDPSVDITEITESEVIKKSVEIENFVSQETSSYQSEKILKRTDLAQLVLNQSSGDENNNIDTPTPSTVPPTPLTDEYVFKLQIPLPKNTGPIIKEDSPDHEDLSIVKKKLVPHIETSIDEVIFYDPPLPTPTEDKVQPVYTKPGLNGGRRAVYMKPGLRGGACVPCYKKEYIREIERKSSLLASAIDQTIKSIEEYKEEVGIDKVEVIEEVPEPDNGVTAEEELLGFRAVQFEPDSLPKMTTPVNIPVMPELRTPQPYLNESGEPLGTVQGIIDGLEVATVDEQITKELGKPGLTEDKIAELISGESEMLREAHVMGLKRVLSTHMNKPDDSSVDFNKIKPLMDSLKHSQVIAALNEELLKNKEEEKKKEDRKWTTFLQKPQRPAPRAKCGYYGYLPQEENEEGPYKVKIVKQPKPKVAPDFKPEDFETGPLPWEQRALTEPPPPPVALEDPILIPEDGPEFLEAVDPLTESQVPDLQDTGIILPPPKPDIPEAILEPEETPPIEEEEIQAEEKKEENKEDNKEEMKGEVEEMAEQLVQNVKNMVDPHAPIQQQLAQMRAQLTALAQLPCVIQQSLEILTCHLENISQQETRQTICESQPKTESFEEVDLTANGNNAENRNQYQENSENDIGHVTIEEIGAMDINENTIQEEVPEAKITLTAEEYAALKREEEMLLEEQMKSDKLKKIQEKIEQESRQRSMGPRKPQPAFGPLNPEVRPLVLPGGRRWKGPKDVFNDQFIAETLQAQSEIIQGKVMGVNFMKYEKPPVSLDHLQHSHVYKAVHGMEQPMRRVDLLTPVVAEADYRERCRSMTPGTRVEEHLDIPQQLQP